MGSKQQSPNVYTIKTVNVKGVVKKISQHQLFNLKRSLGDLNPTVSVPNISVPNYQPKKKLMPTPLISHPYDPLKD